jgi:hypothetical protein
MPPRPPRATPAPPLVIGNAEAIRTCLGWLQEVDQTCRQLAGALDLALRSGQVGCAAKNVVLGRLHQAAFEHAVALTRLEQRHEEVITAAVWSWAGPMVGEARDACLCILGLVERRTVSPAELKPALDGLGVVRDELRGLWQLLNHSLPNAPETRVRRRRCWERDHTFLKWENEEGLTAQGLRITASPRCHQR